MKADINISSTHPLLPPTKEETRIQWLRLLRSRRVGVATFYRLMRSEGSAEAALAALPKIALDAGVADYQVYDVSKAEREFSKAQRLGIEPIFYGEPAYPKGLAEISDPPPILWTKGTITPLAKPTVAIVGARNASSLGLRMARKLAEQLGEIGFTIVSGLARGIDTAAHEASLRSGTISVLGGGVDVIYPKENTSLAERITASGALFSEAPIGQEPQARHFPARNRIIAGLAQGVIIVEAAAKSGSLITARMALDQGREVMAVPGHPMDARASGCNILIRDGATLVRGVEDVLAVLGAPEHPVAPCVTPLVQLPTPKSDKRGFRETIALHQRILGRLGPHPTPEDQVLRDLNSDPGAMADAIVDLELEDRIERRAGGLLALTAFRRKS